MKSTYVLTKAAEADLREIVRYTRRQWGDAQVSNYIRRMDPGMARLAAGKGVFKDLGAIHRGLRAPQQVVFAQRNLILCRYRGVVVAKVIVRNLQGTGTKKRDRKPASVGQKRVRGTDGELRMLWTLDAGSKTFSNDLTYVFGRNVAKARRENKRVIGQSDCVRAKG